MDGLSVEQLRAKMRPAFTAEQLVDIPEHEAGNYGRYVVVPVALLVKADWNYKTDDPVMGEKLRANLMRNGQVENIQIRELDTGYFEVVNGNHRYDEIVALGREFVVAYNHGTITLAEAMRIAVETNETAFASDKVRLAEVIAQLTETYGMDALVETMPYNHDELLNFQNMLNFDWGVFQPGEDPPTSGSGSGEGGDQYLTIALRIPSTTFELWKQLKAKLHPELEAYHGDAEAFDAKVFEYAVVELLNTPSEVIRK